MCYSELTFSVAIKVYILVRTMYTVLVIMADYEKLKIKRHYVVIFKTGRGANGQK